VSDGAFGSRTRWLDKRTLARVLFRRRDEPFATA
jgi:hypothetical protein